MQIRLSFVKYYLKLFAVQRPTISDFDTKKGTLIFINYGLTKREFCRHLWKKPDSFCNGLYHTLPGSPHFIYLILQHMHEGKILNKEMVLEMS